MRGTREVHGHYQVIHLVGQLDAYSEQHVRRVLGKLMEEGPSHIVLDLSKIDFLDSSGLGVLVQLAKQSQGGTGSFQIVTSPRVTQSVKMVRLEKFLALQPTLEAAIQQIPAT